MTDSTNVIPFAARAAIIGHISKRLEQALLLIVQCGFSVKSAAEATGYRPNSLAMALRRPHVQARKRDIVQAFMASGIDLARHTLVDLLGSKSEEVRHKAARTILEVEGLLGGGRERFGASSSGDVVVNILTGPRVDQRGLTGNQEHDSITVEVLQSKPPEQHGMIIDQHGDMIGD
jgi:hypothetical protein